MQGIIRIDAKDVPFKANGMTVVRYQDKYGNDLYKDLVKWQKAVENGEPMSTDILRSFYHFAHTMAKQADQNVVDDPDEWIEDFEVFPIDVIMPKLVNLWIRSTTSNVELKKKAKA